MRDFRIYRLQGKIKNIGFLKNPLGITSKSYMKFWGHKPYHAIYKPRTTETWCELNRGTGILMVMRFFGFYVRENRIEFFPSSEPMPC